ncbi:hypothetical protein LBMAG53_36100 [Planctomycetota bacterium]|nr:hypothetical protein LBMAG53_36100 [Planctomycetota bacterium]
MSADPHDHGAGHAPAPAEFSHPLLWTAALLIACLGLAGWFIYWFGVGSNVGRDHGVLSLGKVGPVEPDHAALIAKRDDAVIDRGALLYGQQCASCHLADGHGQNGARNFAADAFKSDKGNGPYAMYLTLVTGYGAAMPAFKGMPPADKYAVVHYVREKFMRGKNSSFAEADKAGLTWPPPGAAGGAKSSAKPAPVESLMAGLAAQADAKQRSLDRWIALAAQRDAVISAPLARLAAAKPASALLIQAAVASDDRAAFDAVVRDSASRGSSTDELRLLPADRIDQLFSFLKALASSPTPPAASPTPVHGGA